MDWLEFQIMLAIRLSLQVYHEPNYILWAHKWLDGSDRSREAALIAANSAYITSDAAYAGVKTNAVYAAAYAAFAAANVAPEWSTIEDVVSSVVFSIKHSIELGATFDAILKFL